MTEKISHVRLSERPGAMLLLTVMITGAVALTISLHLALRGMSELDMGFSGSQSLEALAIAEGCLQEGLLQLSRNPTYDGGTQVLGDGTCVITVTGGGSERTMDVAASLGHFVRRVTARVAIHGPRVRLLHWQEHVPDN